MSYDELWLKDDDDDEVTTNYYFDHVRQFPVDTDKDTTFRIHQFNEL